MTHASQSLSIADATWFKTPEVRAIFRALNQDGQEVRIVGGAVRNTLMGLPAGDVDFATTATPIQVKNLARKAGLKPIATGLKHGTITIVVNGHPFEVTTLREDVETHGRHATVAFTRDWLSDAKRRDFTINALYADAEGHVYDPLGGLPDLHRRRVYFIGVARERIREDYLRILRFFRFTAEYAEDGLDAVGTHAVIAERAGLAQLSAERIHAELWRILCSKTPMRALVPMSEAGLLTMILGGIAHVTCFDRMVALEAHFGLPCDPVRRIAALAVMIEEDVARLTTRLRLSNAEVARLSGMAAYRPIFTREMSESAAREQLYRLGEATYRDRVLTAWARAGNATFDDKWRELYSLPERWQVPEFFLKGQDLIAAGVERGPRIGETLRELEAKWIASRFTMSREELLALHEKIAVQLCKKSGG